MPMQFQHGPLTANQLGQINQWLKSINNSLNFLLNLTPAERQSLPKMGDKTVAFVEKGLAYAEQKPELLPGYLTLSDFRDEQKLYEQLHRLQQEISVLYEALDDTTMLVGSQLLNKALTFYRSLQFATNGAHPGTTEMYRDMKARFERQSVAGSGDPDASPAEPEDLPTEPDEN